MEMTTEAELQLMLLEKEILELSNDIAMLALAVADIAPEENPKKRTETRLTIPNTMLY